MIDDFVGREAEPARLSVMVREIESRTGGQQPVIVVSGAPGVGKTTFAPRVAPHGVTPWGISGKQCSCRVRCAAYGCCRQHSRLPR
ncbi:ATP-binding protein [Streptomyces sp. 3R004]|nr:ATP-binding protein [Streptomyces justiciae]